MGSSVHGLHSRGRDAELVAEEAHLFSQPSFSRFLNSRFVSFRLLAIFIVASIFCYWLAWYLTAPARKLSAATRQFASGDLKTRVGQQLGGRKDELADLGRVIDTVRRGSG